MLLLLLLLLPLFVMIGGGGCGCGGCCCCCGGRGNGRVRQGLDVGVVRHERFYHRGVGKTRGNGGRRAVGLQWRRR